MLKTDTTGSMGFIDVAYMGGRYSLHTIFLSQMGNTHKWPFESSRFHLNNLKE